MVSLPRILDKPQKTHLMKQKFIYMLCLLFIAGSFASCKRVASESRSETIVYKDGSKVEKMYRSTPAPEDQATVEEAEAKIPWLFELKAKRLLRKQLKEEKLDRLTVPVRVGYYECNNYNERLNLYKLVANNIITMQCNEIVTKQGSTYWVTVELTWLGKWLAERPEKPQFPEDRITEEEAKAFLLPKLDQDAWGVPSFDAEVSPQIVDAMKKFYGGLQAGHSYDQSLLDAKMACAMSLLETLASYGVNKLKVDPFTRGEELTPEMVENLSVLRLPRLQNAYLVTIGENSFVYVISQDEANVMIEDVAYIAPSKNLKYDQTVCSLAGKLTKQEILRARKAKLERDRLAAKAAAAAAKKSSKKQSRIAAEEEEAEVEEDDFEMCETSGGLMPVAHDEPTLYELAKEAEHYEVVRLLAGVTRLSKLTDIEIVSSSKKSIVVSGNAVYTNRRVNAVGRIYLGLKNGETTEHKVWFEHTNKDGWKLR